MPGRETNRSKLDTERRRFLMGTGAGALAVGMAGCTGGDDDDDGDDSTPTSEDTPTETQTPDTVEDFTPPDGGTFTIGLPQPPRSMNILSAGSAYSWIILDHFVRGGVTLDPVTQAPQPSAYSDWTIENVDSGEPDIYFNVRDGLTWNDGEDFGVDDALFTYNYFLDQQPGRYLSTIDPITEVTEADNDWDVHIAMDRNIGTWFTSQVALPLLPEHIWSEYDDFRNRTPSETGEIVGLGWGAELTQWEPDTSAEVSLRQTPLTELDWVDNHENLYAGGPFLDSVRYRFYESQAVLNQDLFEGELDTYYGSISVSEHDRAQNDDRIGLVQGQDDGISYFAYNLRRTPFDDILFRQALNFLWDEIYWVQRLQRELVHDGDFVLPPAFFRSRPETEADAEMLTDPSTEAYNFREGSPGVPDYDGIRAFLENGEPITGGATNVFDFDEVPVAGTDGDGNFVRDTQSYDLEPREYPGSLTDIDGASVTEPLHDYEFGEPQSDILIDEGVGMELYINGQTIPEILGRPITYLMYPPETSPELTQADENWSQNMIQLGIPVEREVQTFNSLVGRVYYQEDFDLYHMGWTAMDPYGVGTLHGLFHSDNADDHSNDAGNEGLFYSNSMGYGLFDYAEDESRITDAREEVDDDRRNRLVRESVEKIYLDSPYNVFGYDKVRWPVNQQDFDGFLEGIAAPDSTNLINHFYNVYQPEE